MTVTPKHQALALLIAKELERRSTVAPVDVLAPWVATLEINARQEGADDVLDRLQAAILAHPDQEAMKPLFSFVNGEYSLREKV